MDKNSELREKYMTSVFEWIDAAVISLITVILIFTFIFSIVGVDGTSMLDTLKNKDKLVLMRLFYEPKYGDIVVISRNYKNEEKAEINEENKPIIKRVIATEGETVDLKDGLVRSQIRYHGGNVKTMFRIASRLEKFGIGVYYAGVAVTVLRAAVFALTSGSSPIPLDNEGKQYLSKMFNMLSMVVPLFSSLAFGLSAQEGFDRIRARSEAMLGRLELMAGRMDRLGTIDYNAFMKLNDQVTDLILSEFTDWNALIRTKPISDH
jgi:signal peptidase I